jgi:hypothetical protein
VVSEFENSEKEGEESSLNAPRFFMLSKDSSKNQKAMKIIAKCKAANMSF